jgi:hypothetical protein
MTTHEKAPEIVLKGIKHSAFASEETHCYEATLWVDGVKWGTVGNSGHGGCDNFHGFGGKTWEDIRALEERIKATVPKIDCSYMYGADVPAGTHLMDSSLEIICGDLVNAFLTSKELKSALGRYLLFTSEERKGIFEIPLRQKGKLFPAEQVADVVRKKRPEANFLNLMPFEEALAIWRAEAA